jgi:hypothetical protein
MVLAQDSNWYKQNVYTGTNTEYKFIRQYAPTLYKITETGAVDGTVKSFTDEYGRTYTAWADSAKLKGATIYAKDYEEAVATYENQGVDLRTLKKDLGFADDTQVKVITDGTPDAQGEASAKITGTLGGRGSVVEVYDEETYYKVVVINTYVAVVGNIGKDDKTVTLSALNTTSSARTTAVASVEGLTKGDVVSFNKGKLTGSTVEAYNVTKLEATSVVIDANGTDKTEAYIRQGETKYFASKMIGYSTDARTSVSATLAKIGTADVYLDTYGNVLYVETATQKYTKTVDGYFYVLQTVATVKKDGFNNIEAVSAQAEVLDLDTGKTYTINESVIEDKGAFKRTDEFGVATGSAFTASGEDLDSSVNAFYSYYKMDDGTYVLKSVTNTTYANGTQVSGSYGDNGTVIEEGKAVVYASGTKSTQFTGYATASTKLTTIAYDAGTSKWKAASTVTGYTNFPAVPAAATGTNTKTLVLSDGKTIDQIYVVYPGTVASSAVAADPNVYGVLTAVGEEVNNGDNTYTYNYTFKTNNVETTYQTTTKLAISDANIGTVYKLTTDGPFNAVSLATSTNLYGYAATNNESGACLVTAVGDGYIVVKTTSDYSVPASASWGSEAVVYLMDGCQTATLKPDSEGLVKDAIVHIYKSLDTTNHNGEAAFITVE